MECTCLLESAINSGDIRTLLTEGSTDKELIIDLQRMLYELGFKEELKWDEFQADGVYGESTKAAVLAFAQKNTISSTGKFVTKKLGKLIIERHTFLPSMYILWSIHKSDFRTKRFVSKGTRTSITAIQILLNELGYGEQLNFAKFGADGLYGNFTRKAIIAFAKDNGISTDGDLLTRPLINLLLESVNNFYGKHWSDFAENNLPSETSPLVIYEGSRFIGKACQADVEFLPMLEKINVYAEQADVFIFVTSSFRTTTNVNGAIVKPATFSNHLAGHGIDMNLKYGNNKFANSKVLTKYPNVPAPVKQFLKSIIDDDQLRWGGEFNDKDPVHIDDGLNRNRTKWNKRYQAMQKAVQLGQ
ncbi:MAG: peptidoglycan-binding protein [Bacteroidota bacterium]